MWTKVRWQWVRADEGRYEITVMTNGSEQDFKPYYNVPLPTAVQSALDAPSSLSSECASEEPARPPRTRDDGNNVPSYCNLPSEGGRGEQAQPPMLPRRQPHLRASPVALRNQPPPPPPPLPSAPPPTSAHPPRQHIFHFPPSSSSSRDKFSCGHSTASTTASPTLRLPVYQNYRKRSSVIGRSRTLAGTGRRGPAATGCQCGKSGAAAPATESGEFLENEGRGKIRSRKLSVLFLYAHFRCFALAIGADISGSVSGPGEEMFSTGSFPLHLADAAPFGLVIGADPVEMFRHGDTPRRKLLACKVVVSFP